MLFPAVKTANHSTERSRRPQRQKNLTQSRKGAKVKLKAGRVGSSRTRKTTKISKQSLPLDQSRLFKSAFVLNLCAFASLREIFSVFVDLVIFPYCDFGFQEPE